MSPPRQTHEFNHINSQLVNWDLGIVEGEATNGIYPKMRNYGYVKIKMYASEYSNSHMIWNVPELDLPAESGAKEAISEVLRFFVGYLTALKGTPVSLNFEINDGCYHPVDSTPTGYMLATIYAIIDCFDDDYRVLDPKKRTWGRPR